MPVDIKELIVKMEIFDDQKHYKSSLRDEDLLSLKKEILNACRELILEHLEKQDNR